MPSPPKMRAPGIAAWTASVTWTAAGEATPAKKRQSAPSARIRWASEVKLVAVGSIAWLLTTRTRYQARSAETMAARPVP